MWRLLGILAMFLAVACSPTEDDDDDGPAGSIDDRSGADRTFFALAEEALDGESPAQGVMLEKCPVLGDRSVADVVAASDVGLDLDGDEGGTLQAGGDGVSVACWTRDQDVRADLWVTQVPAQGASEYARLLEPLVDGTFDDTLESDGFTDDSLLVRTNEDTESLIWVDDGLAISVALKDGDEALPREEHLAFLAATRDVVTETLAGGEPSAAPDPLLDRSAVLDAFDERLSGQDATAGRVEEDACPFLDEDALTEVVDDAGWQIEPVLDHAFSTAGRRILECQLGKGTEFRTVTVNFGRPRTVSEIAALVEGPIHGPDWAVEPVDSSNPDLDDRAYLVEHGEARSAGWVDNGLRIEARLSPEDDPETVLEAVVPAVLDGLGVS